MRCLSIVRNIMRARVWFGLLAILAVAQPSHANLIFHVSIVTSGLVGSPVAPLALDYQFNSGSLLNNNIATISNFTFGAGFPFGSASTGGGASGAIPGTVVLKDTSFFNFFDQAFTAGTTLGFDVNLTTNVDSGGTPDQFSFAILDKNSSELGTTDPSGAIIIVNLDSATPTVKQFAASPASFGTVTVSPVPEPATMGVGIAFVAVGLARRRPIK